MTLPRAGMARSSNPRFNGGTIKDNFFDDEEDASDAQLVSPGPGSYQTESLRKK